MTVEEFWSSKDKAEGVEGNPLAHLLQEEMPAVDRERAKLIELMNRRKQCKDKYENESKTLKKLITKQAKEEEATTAEGGNKGTKENYIHRMTDFLGSLHNDFMSS